MWGPACLTQGDPELGVGVGGVAGLALPPDMMAVCPGQGGG